MKYMLLLVPTILLATLSASDITENNSTVTIDLNKEFKYIQPIAVEDTPEKAKICKPDTLKISDTDGDGVYDGGDKCPNTKAGEKVDKYGCIVKKDTDKDGVPDEDDRCPNTAEGIKVDYRGCEIDSDDDGVVDSQDLCPNTSKDFVVDGDGCPQTATLDVHFDTYKYAITDELVDDLQNFALFLKENKGYDVIIYGYTDSSGNEEDNQILSQKRADSVMETLIRYGIDPVRLTAIGRGEDNPVADNSTAEGRAQNRRIEVELIK